MAAQSRPIPVILTRPAEQSARFAMALQKAFGDLISLVECPMLRPDFLDPGIESRPWSAVIFTSGTAVAAAGRLSSPVTTSAMKAYCVGDRTADVAQSAGYSAVSAKGGATDLCAQIIAAAEPGPLLHLRGAETYGDIARSLSLAGIETHEAIIYREVAQVLTDAARAVLLGNRPVILPLFSARTAKVFAEAIAQTTVIAPLCAISISENVKRAMEAVALRGSVVAERPDAESMLSAVEKMLIALQAA
jgi:uroporphyrinogen-III synthase